MSAVPYIGFALVAVIAVVFAAVPLFRIEKATTRFLSLALLAIFITGIGGGTYYFLGRPHLAKREANGLAFQHIGILSLEFHVDKLSRPLL